MQIPEKILNPDIKAVIGVISGKGGVGKSTVAVLLAHALAAQGHAVGMLDADITGPSLPRLLGIDSFRSESDGKRIIPVLSEEGIKTLSINLLNEDEDQPVIWRGPLLGKVISQFWTDADWGKLDYLVVDFPPGTSDVALTAFQTIPFTGILVVTTPQEYVSMIVRKSIRMATMLKTPIIGVVENMRSLICPSCGEAIELFDNGSDMKDLPILASLPWRQEVVKARSLRWKAFSGELKAEATSLAHHVISHLGSGPARG